MNLDHLTDWIAILISVAALGFTLWERLATRRELKEQERRLQQQEERAKREHEQQEFRTLLESFLLPLQTSLVRASKGFNYLKHGHEPEVSRLEYFPETLRMEFEKLSDERRVFWQVEIGQLHQHNDDAVQLIDTYASRSRLNPQFRQECEVFRQHATSWKARWDAIIDLKVPRNDLSDPGRQIADTFPDGFDKTVEDEIVRVRREAGLEASLSYQGRA
jgi:hypothetical protein